MRSPPRTERRLAFYATPPHDCSYLPDRQAVTLFADPQFPKNERLHSVLARNGFRRSGPHLYRPHCPGCRACIPVRVAAAAFEPRRRQRRVWRRNQDLTVHPEPARFREEHFELYRRYLAARHRGGGMDHPTREHYVEFLTSLWVQTTFHEFRLGKQLLAVAVTDHLLDGWSAVYSFFEPELPERSLGVYAILWQIAAVRRAGLDWLYLGYLIDESPKMRYKREYQPQEHFVDGRWVDGG